MDPHTQSINNAASTQESTGQQAQTDTLTTELLITADGQIMAHNLTPIIARLLREICPEVSDPTPDNTCKNNPTTN